MLAAWIEREVPAEQRLPIGLRMGPVPVWKWLTPDQRARLTATKLPLPSARLKLAEDDPIAPYVKAVLAEEGLELRDLRVRGIRELFFSKGERSMHCQPFDLSHEWGDDDRHPGKALLRLAFALPRGSYATLIVKRITTPSPDR
jgi:tRNA pseudouridine13 synthase